MVSAACAAVEGFEEVPCWPVDPLNTRRCLAAHEVSEPQNPNECLAARDVNVHVQNNVFTNVAVQNVEAQFIAEAERRHAEVLLEEDRRKQQEISQLHHHAQEEVMRHKMFIERAKQNVARIQARNARLEEEKRQLRWCLEQERARAPEVKLGAVSEAFGESASEGKAERSTAASSVKGSEVLSPSKVCRWYVRQSVQGHLCPVHARKTTSISYRHCFASSGTISANAGPTWTCE